MGKALSFATLVLLNNFFVFHEFHKTFNSWKKEKSIAAEVDSLMSQAIVLVKVDSVQAATTLSGLDTNSRVDPKVAMLTKEEFYAIFSDTYKNLDSIPRLNISRERTQLAIDSLGNVLVQAQERPNFLVPKDVSNLLESWQAGIPFIGIGISLLLLFSIVPLIDKERKKYLLASIYGGAFGIFIIIVLGPMLEGDTLEAIWSYIGSPIIVTGMLALMSMSGFKPK